MPGQSEYGSFMAGGNFIGFIHLLVLFFKKKEKEKKNGTWLRVFDLHGEVMIFSFVYDSHGLWDV